MDRFMFIDKEIQYHISFPKLTYSFNAILINMLMFVLFLSCFVYVNDLNLKLDKKQKSKIVRKK